MTKCWQSLKIAANGKDCMFSKFENKYGVEHWQHGIVNRARPNNKLPTVSYSVSVSLIYSSAKWGNYTQFIPLGFVLKARLHVCESALIKV